MQLPRHAPVGNSSKEKKGSAVVKSLIGKAGFHLQLSQRIPG